MLGGPRVGSAFAGYGTVPVDDPNAELMTTGWDYAGTCTVTLQMEHTRKPLVNVERRPAMDNRVVVPFRSGSCICRGVQFRVKGDPIRVGICHCTDCRKTSGAPFAAFAIWPRTAFEQKSGFTNTYAGRSYCTTCGGRTFSVSDDEVEIMIGSFDEAPTDLTPQYELWTRRREKWFAPLAHAAQFEGDRLVPNYSQAPSPGSADKHAHS
jgi:hypothetical protein